jgi:hypothetical protein
VQELFEDNKIVFPEFLRLCHLEMSIFDVDESDINEEVKKNIDYHFAQKSNSGIMSKGRWFGVCLKNTRTNQEKTIYLFGDEKYTGYTICDKLIMSASWSIDNPYMATSYPYLEVIYETLKEVLAENFSSFLHYLIVDKSCPLGTKHAVACIPETGPETIRLILSDKLAHEHDYLFKKAIQHPNAAQWATFI